MFSAIVSALHVLAMALGVSSVYLRGRALRRTLDRDGLARLFAADNAWGIAALLLLATGLLRAFGGLEKGSHFYLSSRLFWTKMALFIVVFLLEIWPMTTFIRWRAEIRRGRIPDTSRAHALYGVTHVELMLAVLIVFAASFMARGFGVG